MCEDHHSQPSVELRIPIHFRSLVELLRKLDGEVHEIFQFVHEVVIVLIDQEAVLIGDVERREILVNVLTIVQTVTAARKLCRARQTFQVNNARSNAHPGSWLKGLRQTATMTHRNETTMQWRRELREDLQRESHTDDEEDEEHRQGVRLERVMLSWLLGVQTSRSTDEVGALIQHAYRQLLFSCRRRFKRKARLTGGWWRLRIVRRGIKGRSTHQHGLYHHQAHQELVEADK
jgi:hypothetical protein